MMGRRLSLRNSVLSSDDKGIDGAIELSKAKAELAGMEFVLNWPMFAESEADIELFSIREAIRNESEE